MAVEEAGSAARPSGREVASATASASPARQASRAQATSSAPPASVPASMPVRRTLALPRRPSTVVRGRPAAPRSGHAGGEGPVAFPVPDSPLSPLDSPTGAEPPAAGALHLSGGAQGSSGLGVDGAAAADARADAARPGVDGGATAGFSSGARADSMQAGAFPPSSGDRVDSAQIPARLPPSGVERSPPHGSTLSSLSSFLFGPAASRGHGSGAAAAGGAPGAPVGAGSTGAKAPVACRGTAGPGDKGGRTGDGFWGGGDIEAGRGRVAGIASAPGLCSHSVSCSSLQEAELSDAVAGGPLPGAGSLPGTGGVTASASSPARAGGHGAGGALAPGLAPVRSGASSRSAARAASIGATSVETFVPSGSGASKVVAPSGAAASGIRVPSSAAASGIRIPSGAAAVGTPAPTRSAVAESSLSAAAAASGTPALCASGRAAPRSSLPTPSPGSPRGPFPPSSPRSGEVMIYQHQRYFGFGWKTPAGMLDQAEWTDTAGHSVRLARSPTEDPTGWEVVVTPGTDPAGWQYGTVFGHLEHRRPGGRASQRLTDVVRRRLWRRVDRREAEVEAAELAAEARGDGQASPRFAGLAAAAGPDGVPTVASSRSTPRGIARPAAIEAAAEDRIRRAHDADARKSALTLLLKFGRQFLQRHRLWDLVPWDLAAPYLLSQKHAQRYARSRAAAAARPLAARAVHAGVGEGRGDEPSPLRRAPRAHSWTGTGRWPRAGKAEVAEAGKGTKGAAERGAAAEGAAERGAAAGGAAGGRTAAEGAEGRTKTAAAPATSVAKNGARETGTLLELCLPQGAEESEGAGRGEVGRARASGPGRAAEAGGAEGVSAPLDSSSAGFKGPAAASGAAAPTAPSGRSLAPDRSPSSAPPPAPAGPSRTLLQDALTAAAHSQAAYGYAAIAGMTDSVQNFLRMATVQQLSWDVVSGASAEAHTEAVEALTGVVPDDVIMSQWHASTYRPAHYVAADRGARCLVLAVRGSAQIGDVISDLAADPMEVRLAGAAGYVHRGIFSAATFLHCSTAEALEEAARRFPGWPLLVTGHSLGGGAAALLAMLLRETGAPEGLGPIHAITIGSAAVASPSLAAAAAPYSTSIVHGADIVPHLSVASVQRLLLELSSISPTRRAAEEIGKRIKDVFAKAQEAALGGGKFFDDMAAEEEEEEECDRGREEERGREEGGTDRPASWFARFTSEEDGTGPLSGPRAGAAGERGKPVRAAVPAPGTQSAGGTAGRSAAAVGLRDAAQAPIGDEVGRGRADPGGDASGSRSRPSASGAERPAASALGASGSSPASASWGPSGAWSWPFNRTSERGSAKPTEPREQPPEPFDWAESSLGKAFNAWATGGKDVGRAKDAAAWTAPPGVQHSASTGMLRDGRRVCGPAAADAGDTGGPREAPSVDRQGMLRPASASAPQISPSEIPGAASEGASAAADAAEDAASEASRGAALGRPGGAGPVLSRASSEASASPQRSASPSGDWLLFRRAEARAAANVGGSSLLRVIEETPCADDLPPVISALGIRAAARRGELKLVHGSHAEVRLNRRPVAEDGTPLIPVIDLSEGEDSATLKIGDEAEELRAPGQDADEDADEGTDDETQAPAEPAKRGVGGLLGRLGGRSGSLFSSRAQSREQSRPQSRAGDSEAAGADKAAAEDGPLGGVAGPAPATGGSVAAAAAAPRSATTLPRNRSGREGVDGEFEDESSSASPPVRSPRATPSYEPSAYFDGIPPAKAGDPEMLVPVGRLVWVFDADDQVKAAIYGSDGAGEAQRPSPPSSKRGFGAFAASFARPPPTIRSPSGAARSVGEGRESAPPSEDEVREAILVAGETRTAASKVPGTSGGLGSTAEAMAGGAAAVSGGGKAASAGGRTVVASAASDSPPSALAPAATSPRPGPGRDQGHRTPSAPATAARYPDPAPGSGAGKDSSTTTIMCDINADHFRGILWVADCINDHIPNRYLEALKRL